MTEELNQQLNDMLTEALQLKEQAKHHQDALLKFEYVYGIKKQMFPDSHQELRFIQTEIATLCNILSMRFLQSQNFQTSLNLLKKAEAMTPDNDRLRAATYNNFACLYRRTKKLRIALTYLEKALEIEYLHLNLSDDYQFSLQISNPADIHLNICAILSQMDKHEMALQHAMRALTMIQEELLILSRQAAERGGTMDDVRQNKQDRFVVITIAYHNVGVEHQFLKQYQYSVQAYTKAVEFASEFLGEGHPMTGNLKNVLSEATKQIANSIEKTLARKQAKTLGTSGRASPPGNSYQSAQTDRTGGDLQLLLKQTNQDMLPNLKKKQHYTIKGMKPKYRPQPVRKAKKVKKNYDELMAQRQSEVSLRIDSQARGEILEEEAKEI